MTSGSGATLLSPGVQVNISVQQGGAGVTAGTVPLVFLTTFQNKLLPGSTAIAPGTLASNANTLLRIDSQNNHLQTFGIPVFQTVEGTPIPGSEQNEYGQLALYEFLGISGNALVVVADIDLGQLTPTIFPPTNPPAGGTYWFNTTSTSWGVFLSNGNSVPGLAWVSQTVTPITSSYQTSFYLIGGKRFSNPATTPIVTTAGTLKINTVPVPYTTVLNTVAVNAAGSGYNVGDTITLAAVGGIMSTAAILTVATTTAGPGTGVATFTITNAGVFTENAVSFTQASTSGSGSGATFQAPTFATTLDQVVTEITAAAIPNIRAYTQRLSQASALVIENGINGAIDFTGTNPSSILTDLGLVTADMVIMPKLSVGIDGSFAVVTTSTDNVIYQKLTPEDFTGAPDALASSFWWPVGSANWKAASPTVVVGSVAPTSPIGMELSISDGTNTVDVTFTTAPSPTIAAAAVIDITAAIAALSPSLRPTVIAATQGNALQITNTSGTGLTFANVSGTPLAALGIANLGGQQLFYASHTQIPANSVSGNVWIKTTTPNSGAKYVVQLYNANTGQFAVVTAPFFDDDDDATASLGVNAAAGTLYVQYNLYGTVQNPIASQLIKVWAGKLPVKVQGTVVNPTVTNGYAMTINDILVNFPSGNIQSVVNSINAAGIPNVMASLIQLTPSSVQIVITNSSGLSLTIADTVGTPLEQLGLIAGEYSNWSPLTYTASPVAPTSPATQGQLWYNPNFQVDIMANVAGDQWVGYLNAYPNTNPTGVFLAGSPPTAHTDGGPLVDNDLWIDTTQTSDYPVLYQYYTLTSSWQAVDVTDHTSPFGIVFADARYTADGTTGGSQIIEDMLVSNFVDPDTPDPRLYPAGMLLFNTRYSTFNVKQWEPTYFASYVGQTEPGMPDVQYNVGISTFPPGTINTTNEGRWVTASGNDYQGVMYAGRLAQRQMVIRALSTSISTQQDIRAEGLFYNLILTPGYPEVFNPMIQLNLDKKQIAFIIGDTPARLPPDSTSLANWATDVANVPTTNDQGLAPGDMSIYQGLYYPWGFTQNLDGTQVVVPPTHYALSVYGFNDNVAAPWFAPAGTQRGAVNVSSVGYITSAGEYQPVQLSLGARNTLYQNNINPVAFLPNRGLYVFGQKTITGGTSPLSRVAGARLVNYLRWWYDYLAQPFLFQQNDENTWSVVRTVFNGFNSNLVSQQAIQDYTVVCDITNNPVTTQALYELFIDVAILPIFAIEFIYIPVVVADSTEGLANGNGSGTPTS